MPHKSHHSASIQEFARRIGMLAAGVPIMSNEYKKTVATRVHERVVMATPVDTSQAISNWQVATLGTGVVQNPVPAFFVGEGGSTEMASIISVLSAAAVPIKASPINFPIVISNVVDYIGALVYNDRSPQATGDWLGLAMVQGMHQGLAEANLKVVW